MIKQGDTIGIIALGGNCNNNDNFDSIKQAVHNLKNMGYKVVVSSNIYRQDRYLAGSDSEKIEELHNLFLNPEIKLILNARGGYGSIRLIDKINYDIIKTNPKPFCGFSDITALLLMFYKRCKLITYHGPMVCSDFVNLNSFTQQNFFKALNGENLEFYGRKTYINGFAKGVLWGGNLSTVVSLCGQDFVPNKDFIFFAEDLNEPVYKIDKMFTQLFNMPKFSQNCKGIVLGDFLNIDNQEWLEDLFRTFTIPTIGGFKITHLEEKITLPIGKTASIENQALKIL